MDPLLTTEDVAEFFRVDVVTVRRMISKGELTAYRVGGEYRFARSDIEAYLERQRLPARTEGHGPVATLLRHAGKLVPAASPPGPFDRFTKRAKTALALAQEEAQYLHHHHIGVEHLLLGVLREGEGVGARLLGEGGCDLEKMRQAVRQEVGLRPIGDTVQGDMPVTPGLKQVLQLAVDEAHRLDQSFVGIEHLVLGLLGEGKGVAGRLLRSVGMDPGATRSRVLEILAREDKPEPGHPLSE